MTSQQDRDECGKCIALGVPCGEHTAYPVPDGLSLHIPEDQVDGMVQRMRASLWATWGAGRKTTDWPSDKELRLALEAALYTGAES